MLEVVRNLGTTVHGSVAGIAVLGLLFLAWVVVSRRRTRHLVELLQAMRRPR